MIMPTLRASFSRTDALHLVDLLGRHDADLRAAARDRLEAEGLDALLDDPRVLNALLTDQDVKASPEMVFYVMVRQSLLEAGVDDRATADYVASVVTAFGKGTRAYRVSDDSEDEYRYLVDMVARMDVGDARERFLLRTHLGEYSLWLAGLFPDYVEARTRRRGAPSVDYYDRMGASGYWQAAESTEARTLGVEKVLGALAKRFNQARVALNNLSDRYLYPSGDPVSRLLRQVVQGR